MIHNQTMMVFYLKKEIKLDTYQEYPIPPRNLLNILIEIVLFYNCQSKFHGERLKKRVPSQTSFLDCSAVYCVSSRR